MSTLTLSLPDEITDFVHKQVAAGGHATADEYVLTLLRRVQQRAALEEKLLASVESVERGEGVEMTPGEWADIRREVQERLGHC